MSLLQIPNQNWMIPAQGVGEAAAVLDGKLKIWRLTAFEK
jgi:hypothetical protein